ncbi:MAG: polysaccharide biosynthesis tyrosine autokinase [Pseudomonadota bacterium]
MNTLHPAGANGASNDVIFATEPAMAKASRPDVSPSQSSNETPLMREYLGVLDRRKWVIVGILILALLAGLAATLMMTPQYTAAARIEISRQEQRITNVEGLEKADRTFDQEFYDTQYELLQARSVAERVVRERRLASDFAFFEAHGIDPATTEWLGEPGASTDRETLAARRKAASDLLLANIGISPIPRSALVDITYTSADPDLSAAIATEWAQQFMADSTDRRFDSTADARQLLERRLAELRQRVEESQTQLVTYANEKGIVILDQREDEGRTTGARTLVQLDLQAMNSALLQATQERVALQARANAAARTNGDLTSNPAINALRQERSALQAEYAKLMVQFEPGYPVARAMDVQIEELGAAITREEARVRGSAQTDYRAAMARERDLRAKVSGLTDRLNRQERDRIQYTIFQNEVDTNRQLYDGLLQRYKEIGVAGVAANNISLVDPALVPSGPSSPNLPLNLMIALFGGLAMAGAIVFALEQFEEGIRDPAQVAQLTGLPLLGVIPATDSDDDVLDDMRDPKSDIAEAYLTVQSNLALATSSGIPRTLMVTSTRPAEGKSTSGLAIASVLARTGRRVLMIDADMRSPSAHTFLDMENAEGFSSALAGHDDPMALVRATPFANLSLMSAGQKPPSAAELLSGDNPRAALEALSAHFDHIVVDAPPLLGLADAPLIANAVAGVVFVIEARGVASRAINASLGRLHASRAPMVGAIFTKFEGQGIEGYGGYGYGYGYGAPATQH